MNIEERLLRLERPWADTAAAELRIRRLLLAIALTLGALTLAWAFVETASTAWAGGDEPAGKIIRANAFVLEDDEGRVRAQLSTTLVGPMLTLYDENGKTRVSLATSPSGSALDLYDENGEPSASLSVSFDSPMLRLSDENEKTRALLGAGPILTPEGNVIRYPERSLVLLGADGRVIWRAPR